MDLRELRSNGVSAKHLKQVPNYTGYRLLEGLRTGHGFSRSGLLKVTTYDTRRPALVGTSQTVSRARKGFKSLVQRAKLEQHLKMGFGLGGLGYPWSPGRHWATGVVDCTLRILTSQCSMRITSP